MFCGAGGLSLGLQQAGAQLRSPPPIRIPGRLRPILRNVGGLGEVGDPAMDPGEFIGFYRLGIT